jgi:hypothetical protein
MSSRRRFTTPAQFLQDRLPVSKWSCLSGAGGTPSLGPGRVGTPASPVRAPSRASEEGGTCSTEVWAACLVCRCRPCAIRNLYAAERKRHVAGSISGMDTDGVVAVMLPADTVNSNSGQRNLASDTYSVTRDTVQPTPTIAFIMADVAHYDRCVHAPPGNSPPGIAQGHFDSAYRGHCELTRFSLQVIPASRTQLSGEGKVLLVLCA